MTDKKSNDSRRKLLKSIAAGSGAVVAGKTLPESWSKPVIDSVMLPAHAVTTTEAPVCGDSVVANTTYITSSTFGGTTEATNATMTNGVYQEATATGTDNDGLQYVRMDLGAVHEVCRVVVGCDYATTLDLGDWGPEYTENRNVEYSANGNDWSPAFNTGTFSKGIQTYSTSFSARYIRIVNSGDGSDYLAVTEFYALVMA